MAATKMQITDQYVRANGTDIYYVEAGQGEPLILLHGGFVSTSQMWDGWPIAYVSHMAAFAEHYRVIAPDTRGCGKTANPGGGSISYTQLADDIAGLVAALDLSRPAICGFSDGGCIATVASIRHPDLARAIVNDAGYDLFDPEAPAFQMGPQMFGGSPDATQANPDVAEQSLSASEQTRPMFELMKADYDGAQGEGYWRTYLTEVFERFTNSPGYTFEDLGKITAPTLIMAGDRDFFCSVEKGVEAYRMFQHGELAILPNTGHIITPLKVQIMIDFLNRVN